MIGKTSAAWWLAILLCLCTVSFFQVKNHWRLQTDILALLPQNSQDPTVRTLRRIVSDNLGRTTLFLVSHAQSQAAREAASRLGRLLESSELFTDVQWEYRNQQQAFFELYFPLRYRFISPVLRHHLEQENGYKYLIERLKRHLYQPTSSFVTRLLEDDPLLFFPALMKSWQRQATGLRVDDGMLGGRRDGQYHVLVKAKLVFNPFQVRTQRQLEASWHKWVSDLHRTFPDLDLAYTSVARFAASTRRQMQRDMLVISLGSLLGITLLIATTFQSVKHLLIALIPLATGLWSAVGISLLVFGEIHALTLVFGSSLIGICIDYSFHYFAHHRVAERWHPEAAMRNILPALSFGALTTLVSYAGLSLTPLVGLRQIAVFASCGIVVSFFTVVFEFPFLLRETHTRAHTPPWLYGAAKQLLTLWQRFRVLRRSLLIIVIALCVAGVFHLRISDSPQALSAPPAALVRQDRIIRHVIGVPPTQRYLIVEGNTAEETLQRLEDFQRFLHTAKAPSGVVWGPILTSFIPSKRRQREDTQAVRRLLRYKHEMAQELLALGFPTSRVQRFFRALEEVPETLLVPEAWLRHNASVGLRDLWLGETSRGTAIMVPIQHLQDVAGLKEAIAPFPGMRYIDQMADFTRLIRQYRRKATLLVGLAYGVIFVLLLLHYRSTGLAIMLPPCLAAFITVGLLGIFGKTFTLMHCLALLLILGIGVDYAIFLTESPPDTEPTTLLALTLSASTTILSFGLLSFSSQAMLQAIGLTTLIGISWAWLLALLATSGRPLS